MFEPGRHLQTPPSKPQIIESLRPWFHNLHLPDGTRTAPDHELGDFPACKWAELAPALPEDLNGWTALDIGCNAGFYSFELARRGASVTAIDSNAHYLRQARWAASEFGLEHRIAFEHAQLYALLDDPRRYDLVLFLGVFYHLRYPLLGLEIAARKARRRLCLQTMILPDTSIAEATGDRALTDRAAMQAPGWPGMAFIEHRLAGDPTNWWLPNHAGVEAMLRSCGLAVVEHPGTEFYVCEPSAEVAPEPTEDYDALRAAIGRDR